MPGNADLLVDWLWEVKGRYVRLADWIGKCLPYQKRSVSYRESGVTRSPDGKLVRRRILFLRSRCKGRDGLLPVLLPDTESLRQGNPRLGALGRLPIGKPDREGGIDKYVSYS